jgi:hypothetical protein
MLFAKVIEVNVFHLEDGHIVFCSICGLDTFNNALCCSDLHAEQDNGGNVSMGTKRPHKNQSESEEEPAELVAKSSKQDSQPHPKGHFPGRGRIEIG